MFYVGSQVGENLYVVVDTKEDTEVLYTKEELLQSGQQIKGVDKIAGTVEVYLFKYINEQITKLKLVGLFPAHADCRLNEDTLCVSSLVGEGIRKLKIPNGVAGLNGRLGVYKDLESVILPDSLVCLGESVFRNCVNLKSFKFSRSLEEIQNACFDSCGLEELNLSETNIKVLGEGCFRNCRELRRVILPKSLSDYNFSMSKCLFAGCSRLEEVVFPSHLTTLPMDIFMGCENLRVLRLPFNLRFLRSDVFRQCSSLQEIHIARGRLIGHIRSEIVKGNIPKTVKVYDENNKLIETGY